jgi:hypothetical protein
MFGTWNHVGTWDRVGTHTTIGTWMQPVGSLGTQLGYDGSGTADMVLVAVRWPGGGTVVPTPRAELGRLRSVGTLLPAPRCVVAGCDVTTIPGFGYCAQHQPPSGRR